MLVPGVELSNPPPLPQPSRGFRGFSGITWQPHRLWGKLTSCCSVAVRLFHEWMTGSPDSLSVRFTGQEPPLSEGGRGPCMWQEGWGTRLAPVACVTLCPWPGPGSATGALCVAGRGQPGLGVSGPPQGRLSASPEVQG